MILRTLEYVGKMDISKSKIGREEVVAIMWKSLLLCYVECHCCLSKRVNLTIKAATAVYFYSHISHVLNSNLQLVLPNSAIVVCALLP